MPYTAKEVSEHFSPLEDRKHRWSLRKLQNISMWLSLKELLGKAQYVGTI